MTATPEYTDAHARFMRLTYDLWVSGVPEEKVEEVVEAANRMAETALAWGRGEP